MRISIRISWSPLDDIVWGKTALEFINVPSWMKSFSSSTTNNPVYSTDLVFIPKIVHKVRIGKWKPMCYCIEYTRIWQNGIPTAWLKCDFEPIAWDTMQDLTSIDVIHHIYIWYSCYILYPWLTFGYEHCISLSLFHTVSNLKYTLFLPYIFLSSYHVFSIHHTSIYGDVSVWCYKILKHGFQCLPRILNMIKEKKFWIKNNKKCQVQWTITVGKIVYHSRIIVSHNIDLMK